VGRVNLPEHATEDEYQAWLAHPDTPPLTALQWAHEVRDQLPICGCGDPEESWEYLRDLMTLMEDGPNWEAVRDFLPAGDAVQQLMLGILDKADLAEHGGQIFGSWLTGKGKRLLHIMRKVTYDDLGYVGYATIEPASQYELVVLDGWWMVRRVSDRKAVYETGDEQAARAWLARAS
jgi:hypothetical protein